MLINIVIFLIRILRRNIINDLLCDTYKPKDFSTFIQKCSFFFAYICSNIGICNDEMCDIDLNKKYSNFLNTY
jgi:hypothetical protein